MKRTALVATATWLGLIAAAHAAPGTAPGPAVNRPIQRPAVVEALKAYEFEILPTANKCGEPRKIDVKVTNKQSKRGVLALSLTAGGVANKISATIPGDKAIVVPLIGSAQKPFDCKKALDTPLVEVKEDDATPALFTKTIKPGEVKMLGSLPQPPPGPYPVWLRRVEVVGACGSAVSPTATLMLIGGTAQPASIKLTFGTFTSTLSASVNPNQPTPVKLPVPTALDCQASTGIPALEYDYAGAFPAKGKLEPQEIVFDD